MNLFFCKKIDEYEQEQQKKDKIIDIMKCDMVRMNQKIEKLEMIEDRKEQYSRRTTTQYHRK